MGNLRDIVDGVGSLEYDLQPDRVVSGFKVKDDVVLRRPVNRSGPQTSEVIVGTILALGEHSATVSFRKGGGVTEKKEVNLKQLSPVTLAFKRHSIQFQPAFRGRV